jgi:hypothetical protein
MGSIRRVREAVMAGSPEALMIERRRDPVWSGGGAFEAALERHCLQFWVR